MAECFTCSHKKSKTLSKTERQKIKQNNIANGHRWKRVPEITFTCMLTGKKICQTDSACQDYKADDFMTEIREGIRNTARKLRQELNSK